MNKTSVILVILVIVAIAFLYTTSNIINDANNKMANGISGNNTNNNSSNSSSKVSPSDVSYSCHQFVLDQLKAPSTAKFDSLDYSKVKNMSGNTYALFSYVDAENGFGAKIRSNYDCTVTCANDYCNLVNLNIKQ